MAVSETRSGMCSVVVLGTRSGSDQWRFRKLAQGRVQWWFLELAQGVISGGFGNSLRDLFSGCLGKSFEDIPVPSNLTAVYTGHKLRDLQTWADLSCTGNEREAIGFRISLKEIMFRKEDSSILGCDAEPLSKKIPKFRRFVLPSLPKSSSTK